MYLVYLFKEKSSGEIIYVGSTARPTARLKEHREQLEGRKRPNRIHRYMRDEKLTLYKDVEVLWCDCARDKEEMLKLEEEYYYKYVKTIKNERPGENRKLFYNPRSRNVVCLNDGKEFRTVTECADHYKKGRTTISNVLIGEKPFTWINNKKHFFKYVD
ncbi:GIY-YIG catalytic domain protein [Bacillus thuringiensis serovar morrisoni]|uniref:GIY-YIG nuclease family protein n=1 Tax=Bacillus thuringiensis TaxID=1428 RepID=UPI0005AF25AB|nr:GIY-YIG nuclease family protein [Bacillus thuringiensis]KIP23794.1 GIY-YIG catalytic domain protein [Bacillus thuringiensis serovar morrisoni]MED2074809.1 GIY-YIG nuclease family protein [Bacillus thuringiensis]